MKIPKGGNQNPYIEEEQTTPCPKEKVQKDKQRSTKHTYKTKDRVTPTPLKTGLLKSEQLNLLFGPYIKYYRLMLTSYLLKNTSYSISVLLVKQFSISM